MLHIVSTRVARRLMLSAAVFLMGWSLSAQASSLDTLARFLQTTRSGRADFTQVVTPPPKAGQAARSKTQTGSFAFVRPTRFRFDYKKPFAQTLVADGQTLWLYDVDLEQITAKPQAQALGNTPASLIATASDVAALQKDFVLQAQPDADGLAWVLAVPKDKDGNLQSVRIGLRADEAGVALVKLDITDALGQRSVLTFDHFTANPRDLGPADFRFVPPKGVDVVRP